MRVIAFIEQAGVIREILTHLGLWGSDKSQSRSRQRAASALRRQRR